MRPVRLGLAVAAVTGGIGLALTCLAAGVPSPPHDDRAQAALARGENPWPVKLRRPVQASLSAMAELGKLEFMDTSLSVSGRQSCATCHMPDHAYGPGGDAPAVLGGPHMTLQGVRPPPSLEYLEEEPAFSVGPDDEENENVTLAQMVAQSQDIARPTKTADSTAQSAAALVPQGGLFWDGRADSLEQQATGPLLNPLEMANTSIHAVAEKLRHASYAKRFVQLFGSTILRNDSLLVDEATFALARYQIENVDFHPFTSKFDDWLEGRARMTPAEMRGYVLYNDPDKANCGGCHVDTVGPNGEPPLFTDHQFEALGVPRNPALKANADPAYHDLGLCGPWRTDMRNQTAYCGMFITPTLRNVARRHVFFHNGRYTTLQQVLDFYDYRDVDPGRIYPRGPDGKVEKYNDIPAAYRANVDVTDPPFDRHPGEQPAMTPQEEQDIIAFLGTLTDGYRPDRPSVTPSRDRSGDRPAAAVHPAP
ncbi:MAG TPA: cytochrome c peroxidase [Rhodopila sp.]|uniref:cytochrome-c peroxidase n=1 Tax=Rhodopila sp. TaxID=2480087 RepID=UPI002BAB0DC4|nr:cytochrome c peroxidase [Rhodopila sp.]HVY15226.1 cytochrome c peroxidase [Rhodopila sp.]